MSRTERIYALLVEANPVPDPDTLPERLVVTEPRLSVVDPRRAPMQTEETTQRESKPSRRALVPALAVAAVVIAAIAAGLLVLTAGGDPDVAGDREQAAVATAEAQLAAITAGDLDAVIAQTTPDGSNAEADRRMYEHNAAFTAVYPWQVEGCEATFAGDEYVNVDCAFFNTDPVFVAEGVSELIAPFFVYDDGRVEARAWQGANFSLANQSYRDYLRLNHTDEYEVACWPQAYPTGSVNHDSGIALTAECAELSLPLAEDIAEWVRLGKPGT